MYAVEDETFQRARSLVSTLAKELAGQKGSGSKSSVDLWELVRRSAAADLPEGGESDYVVAIADSLARLFPIEKLFPRKRRARDQ
jgi:hypothetical protein